MKLLRSLFRVLGAVVAFVLALVIFPAVTHAQDASLVIDNASGEFVVTAPHWSIVTGIVLPFVVGLLLKIGASGRVKAVVGIVVAAIVATVQRATLADGTALFTGALLLDIFLVYGAQLLSYLGVYKNFALNSKLAPHVGIG